MTASEFVATVVVCEHDRDTLDLHGDRLASDGLEPLAARTAEEALWLRRRCSPKDLLVVDLSSPTPRARSCCAGSAGPTG